MEHTADSHELLDLDRLARRLRIAKRWLKAETQAGRIPYLQAGQRKLYNPAAVRAALAQQAAQASHGAEGGSDG